jgi:hypothetical protein
MSALFRNGRAVRDREYLEDMTALVRRSVRLSHTLPARAHQLGAALAPDTAQQDFVHLNTAVDPSRERRPGGRDSWQPVYRSLKGVGLPDGEMLFANEVVSRALGPQNRGKLAFPPVLAARFLTFYTAAYVAEGSHVDRTWTALFNAVYQSRRLDYFVGASPVDRRLVRPFRPYGLRHEKGSTGFILLSDCYTALTILNWGRLPIVIPIHLLIPMYGPTIYAMRTHRRR